MNSRMRSSVHITTGKTPSAKVECHKSSRPNGDRKIESSRSYSVHTNEFLKSGGSLPSVLPAGVGRMDATGSLSGNGKDRGVLRAPMNRSTNVCNNKMQVSNMKGQDTQPTCLLEKKIENLSCKLSKVEDILLSQMPSVEEKSHLNSDRDRNGGFSAHDYNLLILEMKRNVCAQPYNPIDFSVEAPSMTVKRAKPSQASESDNRSQLLQAIEDELSNWRAEQTNSLELEAEGIFHPSPSPASRSRNAGYRCA